MDTPADDATFAHARANIYRFLASVFLAPPTDTLLASVRAADFREAFKDWMDDALWQVVAASAGDHKGDHEGRALHDTLVVEFNRLFVVPGAAYVPPYESVYTDVVSIEYSPHMVSGAGALGVPTRAGELLWGPSTAAVERTYAEAGFAVSRATGEPPDHLGIELQFLARLCDEQAAAWSAEDVPEAARLQRVEREFLQAHPLRWLAQLCGRLDAAPAHPFYRAFARMGESFLQSSVSLLTE